MTRLALLALSATLAAGTAGATTIVSTHGSNVLRIHQSPIGTVIHDGFGPHIVAPRPDREPLVLRHPVRDADETRNLSVFARLFFFLNPFDGFYRSHPAAPVVDDCDPAPQAHRAVAVFDGNAGENRATAMMRTILHRMDR